ncbi:MAG: BON domain-containing protein [Isosphaeraceae bacterium]
MMISRRNSVRFLLFSAVAALSGLAIAGAQDPQPPDASSKSTVKEKLDSAVESVKKGAQNAADAVKEQYHRATESVHGLGEQGRIYARFHWDKHLQQADIDIDVKGTTATLSGTVPTAKAKAKAIELAEDTVGIEKVIDHLTVTAPAPVSTKS